MQDQPPSLGRAADFKPGLGNGDDAVERRAKKEARQVKEERSERMAKTRQRQQPQQQQQRGDFTGILASGAYNVEALMTRGDLISLRALSALLTCSKTADLETHLPELVPPPVLAGLLATVRGVTYEYGVRLPPAGSDALERLTLSLACLVNLTAEITTHSDLYAASIFQQGFLGAAERILAGEGSDPKGELAMDVWAVLGNLTYLSPQMRDAVLGRQGPLPLVICQGLAHCAENAPLICQEFPQLVCRLLFIACAASECGPMLFANPDVVATMWSTAAIVWMRCFPHPMRASHAAIPGWLLDYCICTLDAIASRASHELLHALVMRLPGAQFLAFLVQAVPRLDSQADDQQKRLKVKALRILVAVGRINVEHAPLQRCMVEAGAIPMMREMASGRHGRDRVQREAIMWLGNLAAEAVNYVDVLLEAGAFEELCQQLQAPTSVTLVDGCLFALMTAVKSALYAGAERGGAALNALLYGERIKAVHLMAMYVDRPGKNAITIEILELWLDLLQKWRPATAAKALLEECGALEQVVRLLGNNDARIYRCAEAVEKAAALVAESMQDDNGDDNGVAWDDQQ